MQQKQCTVTPLGTGNALLQDAGNYHSNFVVEFGSDRLFIDCGSTFQQALNEAKIPYTDIEHLYISHIHADHVGGLEWLANYNAFERINLKDDFATTLYLPQEISGDVNRKVIDSIEPSIKNAYIEGIMACFKVEMICAKQHEKFKVGKLKCEPIELLHVDDFLKKLYSYGLLIEARGFDKNKRVLITTDTQFQPNVLMPYYQMADVILHDCSTAKVPHKSHAHFSELATLPDEIKKKMYLYHYGPGEKPDAVEAGFKGYALPREPIII